MTQPAIPADTTPQGDNRAWYPFPELAGPLESLHGQCVALDEQAARVIRETERTLDALFAETGRAFDQVRAAAAVVKDLDCEQAARVLRDLHEHARDTTSQEATS